MNQENRRNNQLVPDEIAQVVYETLTRRSKRNFDDYDEPQDLPNLTLPAELALFLDEVFEIAEEQKNQDPAETLAEVVDLGIVAWCASLDPKTREHLQMPSVEALCAQSSASMRDLAEAQEREKAARAALERERIHHKKERERLMAQQQAIQLELARLRKELELLDQQPQGNLPNGYAQQPAHLYEETQSAYTPLTSHSLANSEAPNGAGGNKKPPNPNGAVDARRTRRRSKKRRVRGHPH